MNVVTTGLAKARYNPKYHQVHIVFDGWATRESFQETLDIVLEVGLINRTSKWVLNLDQLKGLKPDHVIQVLIHWMNEAYDKKMIYGVKDKNDLSIISKNNLRKYTLAVQRVKNNSMISNWISLRVYENENKLHRPTKIRNKELSVQL
ncbi:MAG: hypothetical protein ACOC3T_06220 [Bacteroidota bacterium]